MAGWEREPEASTGNYGLPYAMPLQEWRMMGLKTKTPSPVCRVLHSLHSSCFVVHCGNDSSGHLRLTPALDVINMWLVMVLEGHHACKLDSLVLHASTPGKDSESVSLSFNPKCH